MAVPNLWRTKKQRYSLQAEICPTCTNAIFPPREVCPHCHQSTVLPVGAAGAEAGFAFSLLFDLPASARAVAAGDD